jgi:hypothetical protein
MSKESNCERARRHYETRAERRPQQIFNPKTNSWEHFDKEPK